MAKENYPTQGSGTEQAFYWSYHHDEQAKQTFRRENYWYNDDDEKAFDDDDDDYWRHRYRDDDDDDWLECQDDFENCCDATTYYITPYLFGVIAICCMAINAACCLKLAYGTVSFAEAAKMRDENRRPKYPMAVFLSLLPSTMLQISCMVILIHTEETCTSWYYSDVASCWHLNLFLLVLETLLVQDAFRSLIYIPNKWLFRTNLTIDLVLWLLGFISFIACVTQMGSVQYSDSFSEAAITFSVLSFMMYGIAVLLMFFTCFSGTDGSGRLDWDKTNLKWWERKDPDNKGEIFEKVLEVLEFDEEVDLDKMLHFALASKSIDVYSILHLLDAGADPNYQNKTAFRSTDPIFGGSNFSGGSAFSNGVGETVLFRTVESLTVASNSGGDDATLARNTLMPYLVALLIYHGANVNVEICSDPEKAYMMQEIGYSEEAGGWLKGPRTPLTQAFYAHPDLRKLGHFASKHYDLFSSFAFLRKGLRSSTPLNELRKLDTKIRNAIISRSPLPGEHGSKEEQALARLKVVGLLLAAGAKTELTLNVMKPHSNVNASGKTFTTDVIGCKGQSVIEEGNSRGAINMGDLARELVPSLEGFYTEQMGPVVEAIRLSMKEIQEGLREKKERLEKERLEKERLEKERLEKERLEKEQTGKESAVVPIISSVDRAPPATETRVEIGTSSKIGMPRN